MKRVEYQSGQKIRGLVFIKEVIKKNNSRRALFQCVCGKEFESYLNKVRFGHTRSCGCLKIQATIERNLTHGLTYHPLYTVWKDMKTRCLNVKCDAYKDYGERGITICNEWVETPNQFIEWALASGWQKGLEIDRINNNGNYEPGNIRFVTHAENSRNRRPVKASWETVLDIRNTKMLLKDLVSNVELAKAFSVSEKVVSMILNNKRWSTI